LEILFYFQKVKFFILWTEYQKFDSYAKNITLFDFPNSKFIFKKKKKNYSK